MRKKIMTFCSILILSLSLVACCDEEASVSVKEDGSSDVEIKISSNKDTFDMIKNLNSEAKIDAEGPNKISPLFEKTANKFEKLNFNITPINSAIETGFRASKSFISNADFNKEIKKLDDAGLIKSDIKLYTKKKINSSRYMIKGNFKYVNDKEYDKMVESVKETNKDYYIPDNYKLRLTVTLPGDVVNSNSKSNVWESSYKDKDYTKVYIESKITNKKFVVITAIVSFMLVITALIIIIKRVKR